MDEQRIGELLDKYRNGKASAAELRELLDWYRNQAYQDGEFPDNERNVEERMLARLNREILPSPKKSYSHMRWIAAAAILLLVSSVMYVLLTRPANVHLVVKNKSLNNRIIPGGNKAILTIAGGRQIVLSDAKNGVLAQEHNVLVTKSADGRIIYNTNGEKTGAVNEVSYNTLTTPRGGEYQVVLPDGSQVWLNAESSITYPSSFVGKERLVQLTGEAYFEVAKNPAMPFKVNVNGKQQVEVLGTHFNINAYTEDQNIKTTLLEGSVRLIYKEKQAFLKPGQIAINNLAGPLIIKPADIQEVMAWRNGLFIFHEQNIVDVMKTISRWYDVDVEFKGDVKSKEFGGVISKYKDITAFLEILKLSGGIRYKIEGRRVIIMD